MPTPLETKPARALKLLSVVIPARDEEGCIASTIEHLHLELSLHGVPHEIVVVDDGSTDSTWQILQGEAAISSSASMFGWKKYLSRGISRRINSLRCRFFWNQTPLSA